MKVQAIVEFQDYGEAARWLATYCSPYTPGVKLLRQEIGRDLETETACGVSTSVIARAAVAVLVERFGPSIKSLEEEVRVLREELEKARAEIARPVGAAPSGGGAS